MLINKDKKYVMGIVNVTPDSFYDGGKFNSIKEAVNHALLLARQGGTILDIGGCSTRPGAIAPSEEEELERVIPIIEELRNKLPNMIISIDTYRAKVAKEALHVGANIINDISGGQIEPEIIDVAVKTNAPYVLSHIQGKPEDMQENPTYKDIVYDVIEYFTKRIASLKSRGIREIIIDPGFGFGKKLEDNYKLLHKLDEFLRFEAPILVGISRKSMLYKMLNTSPDKVLPATISLNTLALNKGANIIRVHDVIEAVQVVELMEIYSNSTK